MDDQGETPLYQYGSICSTKCYFESARVERRNAFQLKLLLRKNFPQNQ